MFKRFLMAFVTAILFLLLLSAVVLADQNGNYRYCNMDQYGCWITEEDGRRSYIMFWSDEIRENFIGNKPAVVCPHPEGNEPTMELAPSPREVKMQKAKPVSPDNPVTPENVIPEPGNG